MDEHTDPRDFDTFDPTKALKVAKVVDPTSMVEMPASWYVGLLERIVEQEAKVAELEGVLATLHKERTAGGSY